MFGNKSIERTVDYLNSLRSIEYLLASYSDVTFLKTCNLNEKQIKALEVLPIKPLELVDYSHGDVNQVKSYIKDIVNKGLNDKYDAFFKSHLVQ